MIIENKKSNIRHQVTEDQWQTLKDIGFDKNWRLVSREDVQQPVTVKEVLEFDDWKAKPKRKPKTKKI